MLPPAQNSVPRSPGPQNYVGAPAKTWAQLRGSPTDGFQRKTYLIFLAVPRVMTLLTRCHFPGPGAQGGSRARGPGPGPGPNLEALGPA